MTTDGDPLIPTITIPSNATAVTITQYGVVNATLAGQQNPSQLGQIQLATFPNPGGLESMGNNLLTATLSSGDPVLGNPGGTEGLGTLNQGTSRTRMSTWSRSLCRWCWRSGPTSRTPR